ncbi:unnamed protein product [Schistosoma mattheei]|uniref:Uncharacterized protein n=1 Tax=Schistosoma mattheei TaxID=31246 RepID=A0A3P8DB62_9TREM|nr:unnamed protein product [Schistosoma mattheei]
MTRDLLERLNVVVQDHFSTDDLDQLHVVVVMKPYLYDLLVQLNVMV